MRLLYKHTSTLFKDGINTCTKKVWVHVPFHLSSTIKTLQMLLQSTSDSHKTHIPCRVDLATMEARRPNK